MAFIFVNEEFIQKTRQNLKNAEGIWDTARYELKKKADEAMTKGPFSVTFSKSPAPSENPHDFYCEGPYWWADPQNPGGQYIRRDGEINYNRFSDHLTAFIELKHNLIYLTNAGFYLEEKCYLDRAVHLITVWFLDPEARMNPHFEYGQAIRGVCTGRGIGIIDFTHMIAITHCLDLIKEYPQYNEEMEGMRAWLTEMLVWLTTSEKGISERNEINNHSSWWNAQVATYAAFTGNEELFCRVFDFYRNVIIPNQMEIEGGLTNEMARTLSMHYTTYNLNALAVLCEVAYSRGVDLWNFKLPDGRGIELGIKFMLPYVDNPYLWKGKQIDGMFPDEVFALQLAALRLGIGDCSRVNKKLRIDKYLIRHQYPLGPQVLLPGFAF